MSCCRLPHGRRTDRAGSSRKEPPASQPWRAAEIFVADTAVVKNSRQMYAETMRRRKEKRAFELYENELTPIERGYRQEREARKQNGTGGFEWPRSGHEEKSG